MSKTSSAAICITSLFMGAIGLITSDDSWFQAGFIVWAIGMTAPVIENKERNIL